MAKKESVNVTLQTIFAMIPIFDLYAAYKIERLIKYVLIMIGISITTWWTVNFFFVLVLPYPYNMISTEAVLIPIAVFLIRNWSKKWNEKLSKLM